MTRLFTKLNIFFASLVVVGYLTAPLVSSLLTHTAQYLDTKLNPVHSDYLEIVDVIYNEDGSVSVWFSAEKLRDCRRVDSFWFRKTSSGWKPVSVIVDKDSLPPSRPLGKNFSPKNTLPKQGEYRLRIDSDCGFSWLTPSELGPFNLYKDS